MQRIDNAKRIRDSFEVYSSIVIGSGAGLARLFVHPLGQAIPRLGVVPPDLFATHSMLTTNLMQASQLGANLGDFAARAIRLDFIGAALEDVQRLIEAATYRLRVAAREVSAGGLRDLPTYLGVSIPIDHHDTLDMEIAVYTPILISRPFLLRAALIGTASFDVC